MRYCEFCGKPIEKGQTCTCAEASAQVVHTKGVKDAKKKLPLLAFAVVGAILLIAVICFVSVAMKVDPFDYVEVNYSGYNTNGSVDVNFNEGLLISELLGEPGGSEKEFGEWFAKYDAYSSGLSISYSPKKGLSNGDTVTVTIVSSGEAKGKVKSGEKTFIVEGLPEVETVDIFKDVKVVFEGMSGDASARINLLSDSDLLNACHFTLDKSYDLSEGDVVTVSIQNADSLAEKYYCVPKETSKTFTVPALAKYLTDTIDLPLDVIRDIIDRFVIDETREDESWFSYSETTYYKTFFAVCKDGVYSKEKNTLFIYVTYDQYMRGEYWRTVYTPLEFRNIIVEADGTIELLYENGWNSSFCTDFDREIERLSKTFTLTEVFVD